MVVKRATPPGSPDSGFESCVVLDGSQTLLEGLINGSMFESCVVLDGSQTIKILAREGW